MPSPLNLHGVRFGKLTVLSRDQRDNYGAWQWNCICDCGRKTSVRGSTLKAGRTLSCASCATALSSTTHGGSGSNLYSRWRGMLDRCERPRHAAWPNYGGRGIKVCDAWHDFSSFLADVGAGFAPGLEIDRVDPNGNYEPSNVRWVSRDIQQNNRRNNHRLLWRGSEKTIKEWSLVVGISPSTINWRLRRGWSVDRALSVMPYTTEIANA